MSKLYKVSVDVKLCEDKLCVCVEKFCVSKLCDDKLGWDGRRRLEEADGMQNQKQEPHTKMWGKTRHCNSISGI